MICSKIEGDNQLTFAKRRFMMHNIIICHNIFRYYNKKTISMSYEIRSDESHDIVNWVFLEKKY